MKLFFVALSLVITVPSMALSCNFKNPSFGSELSQAFSLYNFNSDTLKSYSDSKAKGEIVISENGRVVCQYLPEDSTVSLTYIDNKLVNIAIDNPQDSGYLLKYTKEVFGNSDDVNRKKMSGAKTSLAMWGKIPQYTVVYLSGDTNGGGKSESLNISSKNHADLFARIAEEKERKSSE